MSFIETRSAISICNKALARIYEQPLAGALDDPANRNKLSGRECARSYPDIVRNLLEQHHFGLATKRVALVARSGGYEEWAYSYAPPADMAFPVTVQPYGTVSGATAIGYYRGLGYLIGMLYGRPMFRLQGGVIYSSQPNATLDYVSFDITEQEFTATFEKLVVQFLAAELALSIAKDRQLSNDLRQEAMNSLNLAIAQSLNATQPRYGDGPSEAELARSGFDPRLLGTDLRSWR